MMTDAELAEMEKRADDFLEERPCDFMVRHLAAKYVPALIGEVRRLKEEFRKYTAPSMTECDDDDDY